MKSVTSMCVGCRSNLTMALFLSAIIAVGFAGCGDDSSGGSSCPNGYITCDGVCIDPLTDTDFCGASADCEGANAGMQCEPWEECDGAGGCVVSCQPGLVDCNSTCIDPMINPTYCGATGDCQGSNAGVTCGAGEICDGTGNCASACGGGLISCGGVCVDPLTNRAYCGASGDCQGGNAGVACAAGEICDGAGSCALSCQSGLIDCNGTCVDRQTNRTYCGASGDCQGGNAGLSCGAGEICAGGTCTPSCAPPAEDCNGVCTNTMNDPANCGSCGHDCGAGMGCHDGDCFDPCPFWNGLLFPIAIAAASAYGDVAFDGDGNLLHTAAFDEDLYKITRTDGVASVLAADVVPAELVSVVYRASDGRIYVNSLGGELLSMDTTGGDIQTVASLGHTVNAITLAPAGFGAFGDQIITCGDQISAVDPATSTITPIGTPPSRSSDCVFDGASTLYSANYPDGVVQTVTSAGVFTNFATGFSSPDGLAVDNGGNRLFVAASGNDTLYEVTIPGAVVSSLGTYNFDGGYGTTGLVYNECDGVLIMSLESGGSGVAIVAIMP